MENSVSELAITKKKPLNNNKKKKKKGNRWLNTLMNKTMEMSIIIPAGFFKYKFLNFQFTTSL
jgi:hypothetical protein